MTRVYLTEQGAVGHKRGGRLEVDKDGQPLLRVPLAQVEQVVVVGKGIQLSTALLVDLLRRGVEVAFLSRSGRYYGKASGAPNGGALVRAAQHAYLANPSKAASFASALVCHKLAGQDTHLQALGVPRAVCERIALLCQAAGRSRDVDQVRGYEGAAAALYWQALVPLVPPGWGFQGRRHHPAPDPLNAALSFGYTLVLQELVACINIVGLDPFLGALHTPDASRPSLALDLEEPLRPLGVDVWVLGAVLQGSLALAHFHMEEERVLLTPDGRRQFMRLYESQLARRVRHPLAPGWITLRQALELQARLASQVFAGTRAELEPLQWR
ncbi:MAG: CRISPR-associated endonuclease Cas1 [Chloroflexi bacterium]|nr:CRISPR-associated endonuclease Cas1 [Chloroflexota bacterium]